MVLSDHPKEHVRQLGLIIPPYMRTYVCVSCPIRHGRSPHPSDQRGICGTAKAGVQEGGVEEQDIFWVQRTAYLIYERDLELRPLLY